MKIPLNVELPTRFLGNYFCLIPNTRLAFVIISKNGCTFLKKVALYNQTGRWLGDFSSVHNAIGYTEESPYLIPVTEMAAYEKEYGTFIKIAVWRKPIDRITSAYKLFCLEREYRTYFHFMDINYPIPFSRFMDFLRFEWGKENPVMIDEHIRRQVDYFKPEEVDHIIPIEKLHEFLEKQNIKFVKEYSNKTNVPFTIPSEDFITEIEAYYQADYHIPITYK